MDFDKVVDYYERLNSAANAIVISAMKVSKCTADIVSALRGNDELDIFELSRNSIESIQHLGKAVEDFGLLGNERI